MDQGQVTSAAKRQAHDLFPMLPDLCCVKRSLLCFYPMHIYIYMKFLIMYLLFVLTVYVRKIFIIEICSAAYNNLKVKTKDGVYPLMYLAQVVLKNPSLIRIDLSSSPQVSQLFTFSFLLVFILQLHSCKAWLLSLAHLQIAFPCFNYMAFLGQISLLSGAQYSHQHTLDIMSL